MVNDILFATIVCVIIVQMRHQCFMCHDDLLGDWQGLRLLANRRRIDLGSVSLVELAPVDEIAVLNELLGLC